MGYVSGARVTGRDISRELGLAFIWVNGIYMTRSRVAVHGGEVVEGSHLSAPGGTGWLATFPAPAGNVSVRMPTNDL